MKRIRKESEQDGNARRTDGCWTSDAGETRNHDDQSPPMTRVIGRAHLKPLLVSWSSSDVEVFDWFILQLLRAKGIADEPTDSRQVHPVVCLMPFRPMFISAAATSTGVQTAIDGASGIWQISPVPIRSYIEDLLTQPVLFETFIARGRVLGLAEVPQSLLQDELFSIIHLLDVAAAEDLASLHSEEREMLRQMRRKRCAAAKQAARMKETMLAAAAAAAGDASSGGKEGLDPSEDCLPRCEDLIVIGIGIGKGGAQTTKDDLERRGSSDDNLRRRRKGRGSDGGGEAGVGEQGDIQGAGQGEGFGDTTIKDDGSRRKKKKKSKKKKKKPGKGSSEGSGGSEEGDEGEEEEEEEQETVEKETGDHGYDDEGDDDGSGSDDDDDWLDGDDDGKPAEDQVPEGRSLPSLGTPTLPRGSMRFHRGSVYRLEFTPAFVFSYFQTMPPHYFDETNLSLLIDRFSAKSNLKKSR